MTGTPSITESFVDAVRGIDFRSLPAQAVDMSRQVTLDGLAVMIAGIKEPMGVECGLLAKMGWTASPDVFGSKGFFDAFMPGNSNPALLNKDFGTPWRMVDPGVGFKKHPSHIVTHRSIDAALALRQEFRIRPEQIARIEITYAPFDLVNRPQPKRIDKLTGRVGYPLTREQRLSKFFSCARGIITDENANRLLELVENLETLADIRELTDIARGSGTA